MSNKIKLPESRLRSVVVEEVKKVIKEMRDFEEYPRHVQDAVVTLDANIENIEKIPREGMGGYQITIPATEFSEDKMRKLGRRGIRALDIEHDRNLVHITISD